LHAPTAHLAVRVGFRISLRGGRDTDRLFQASPHPSIIRGVVGDPKCLRLIAGLGHYDIGEFRDPPLQRSKQI
jgi:hypothetical protein